MNFIKNVKELNWDPKSIVISDERVEDTTKQPVDDMSYYPVCKLMLSNSAKHVSRQVVVHNVKLTKNLTDVINASKQYLEVSGFPVTSSYSSLLKSPL